MKGQKPICKKTWSHSIIATPVCQAGLRLARCVCLCPKIMKTSYLTQKTLNSRISPA